MASCANWQYGYFSAYRHMAAGNFDLVFFLGDYIYESTLSAADSLKAVRPHDGPTATTLKAYRNRHALYKTDPDLQALHASTSCLATWDDHEFANDYAGEWSQTVDTDPKAFLRRRAAAYQAYYEHMPLRPRSKPNGSSMSLHSRRRFGSLASIALLDTRQYRSIQPCALPTTRKGHVALDSCTDRLDPNRTFLGAQQEAFLYEGFHRLDTAWNLIFQSQLVAQLRRRDAEGNMGVWTDCWDGYPAARQRMLDAIASGRPSNPVFFGGDIHSFWANELKLDFNNPASRSVATEFVGTSVTSDGPSYVQMLQVLPQNPHVQFFESRYRGYMEVDLTRSRMDTRFQIITDRRNPAARVTTLRQFFVEAGRPGVTS
jgi:alkaline phosphatase D